MRAVVIVDGLNLYHALRDLGPNYNNLDISRLSRRLLPKNVEIPEVFYFTSAPEHLGNEVLSSHRSYVQLLVESGVKVIEGRFQKIATRCQGCGEITKIHREKETDVSIALKIVEAAGKTDTRHLLLFSADSDLSPALRLAKQVNPEIKITVSQTFAYLRRSHSALMAFADEKYELRSSFINNYKFELDLPANR